MGVDPSPPLSSWLRVATRRQHEDLERTEFARALVEMRLPLAAYVGYLKAMSVVHGVVEQTISSVDDPHLRRVWRDDLSRTAALEADLEHFHRARQPEPRLALEAALDLGDAVLRRSVVAPTELVGCVYVLTGAAMGQASLAPIVANTYALSGPGLAYMRAFGAETPGRLQRLKAALDELDLDREVWDGVLSSARDVFRAFTDIFAGLFPLPPDDRLTAVSLNPEAGRHAIPRDPREIGAATLAGRVSWDEFPYFELRYGERGKRFTRSDGAWLATLCELEPAQIDAQIEWLTRVLAARGMPSYLMERHLRNLHHHLVETVPARAHRYDELRRAAERLADARRGLLPDHRFTDLGEAFDAELRGQDGFTVPRVGRLLVAAVLDEALGRANAVDSLAKWLTDRTRFSAGWVEAVERAVATTRRELGLVDPSPSP